MPNLNEMRISLQIAVIFILSKDLHEDVEWILFTVFVKYRIINGGVDEIK